MRPSLTAASPPTGTVEAEAPPSSVAEPSPPSNAADVTNPPSSNAVVDSPTPNSVDSSPPSDAVIGLPSNSNVISSTSWWSEASSWPEVVPNSAAQQVILEADTHSGYSEAEANEWPEGAADYGNPVWEGFHSYSWQPTAAPSSKQPASPKSTFSSLAGALG